MRQHLTVGLCAVWLSTSTFAYAQGPADLPSPPGAPIANAPVSPLPADVKLPSDVAAPPPAMDAAPPPVIPGDPGAPSPSAAEKPALPDGIAPPPLAAAGAPASPDSSESKPAHFDDFGASIFYKPQEISKLKVAIDIADTLARKAAEGLTKVEEAIAPLMPEPPKIEILEYPVFYLSSIVYEGAGKWVIWLNGTRTTPATMPTDLKMLGINSGIARFQWKPSTFTALENRWGTEEGDIKKSSMKKLLSAQNLVKIDAKTGVVEFSLRPNQSYSSAYNAVLEGRQVPVAVSGDDGVVDMGAFERTMRDAENQKPPMQPKVTRPVPNAPRVIRPGASMQAPVATAPGAPAVTMPSRPVRRSGLVTPDAATLGQVPAIFPGGMPGTQPVQPAPAADSGLPILPSGAGN